MCGIAGIWHLNGSKLEREKLKSFTDSMFHRGPDGAGYYLDDAQQIGLGHRRLSILDLSDAGKQPMSFADGRYWITYNGEIYNFLEVREELKKSGYGFQSESDTEVILASYHKWGQQCLYKFNGMWALAIWDNHSKNLFLARDRFGVKPLYYSFTGNMFCFASETIAFNHLEGFKKELDDEMLIRSIASSTETEPTGRTFYRGIRQLKAGNFMVLAQNQPPKEIRWWNTFEHIGKQSEKFDDQVGEFKSIFKDACKLRLRSDVPVASALSGGVDSSAVYCMINHLMKQDGADERTAREWQKAFVAVFPGTPQDEYEYARQVVDYTQGNALYIEPNFENLAQDIIHSTVKFDAITGTPINVVGNIYKSMKANGITVSMDGHGADELMYGYRSSVAQAYMGSLDSNPSDSEGILGTYLNLFLPEQRDAERARVVQRARQIADFNKRQSTWFNKIKNAVRGASVSKGLPVLSCDSWLNNRSVAAMDFEAPLWPPLSLGEAKLAADFHLNFIPYNLRDFDRAAMQHGIEIRMPFMDYRLVTFLFSLPQQSKLGNGFTKLILREAMKGIMPESIRTRTLKIGLSAPLTNWFNAQLGDFIMDETRSRVFLDSPYWNGKLISDFVLDKTSKKAWTDQDADKFWPVFNAHLILAYGSK